MKHPLQKLLTNERKAKKIKYIYTRNMDYLRFFPIDKKDEWMAIKSNTRSI